MDEADQWRWASLVTLDDKESACNGGVACSIPGLRISLGGENGKPLQYSCLGNSMVRGT